jgi:hypothetical protein
MFSTAFHLDRIIAPVRMAEVFASATGVSPDRLRVITRDDFVRSPWRWFTDEVNLGIQTALYRGDFPFEVELFSREDLDMRSVLQSVVHDLGVAALTDEFDVNPLADSEWLMISPDGSSTVVYADSDEFGADDPAIILEPESRAIYEAKRSHTPSPV